MKPRFTTPGILKSAGLNKRISTEKKANRAELVRALEIAEHGMVMMSGMTAYDAATPQSSHPKHHFKVDFETELKAIKEALRGDRH
jgi:hypothetical protein